MVALLQLQQGSKSFGPKDLFLDASFIINEDEHVGVIGPNGAGKTTLFKVLIGQQELDSGQLITSNQLRLGYLAQEDSWSPQETIEEILTRECTLPLWEVKSHGRKLGLTEDMWERPISSFSGGYRMRVKLLCLIGREPNLLLLDEPTNYLDLETILVFENFLLNYSGAFLLISHDREFLRRVTDHTLEVEGGDISKFPGNIDDYFEQKALLQEQLAKRAQSLSAKRNEVLDFAARFGAKASKAKQVQSRLRRLEKMETVELKPLPVRARIKLTEPIQTGKNILRFDSVTLGYGSKHILDDVRFSIQRGDRVGVVGLNGAGKSTLLKSIAGELPPLSGEIEVGHEVTFSYFAQHVAEKLDPSDSVYEALSKGARSDAKQQDILDIAGSLLFSGNKTQQKISSLSGGEKSRVALGQILLRRAPCLILDEPTNHLDFDTVEALTQALNAFKGTLVFVSHDRAFVQRVASKILEVRHGNVGLYLGSYDDYVWSVQKGALSEREEVAVPKVKNKVTQPQSISLNDENKRKDNQKTLRALEKQILQQEKEVHKKANQLNEITEKLIHANKETVVSLQKEHAQLKKDHDAAEEQWLLLLEQQELLQKS